MVGVGLGRSCRGFTGWWSRPWGRFGLVFGVGGATVGGVGVGAGSMVGRFVAVRRPPGGVGLWCLGLPVVSGGSVVFGVEQDECCGDDLPDAPGVEADVA